MNEQQHGGLMPPPTFARDDGHACSANPRHGRASITLTPGVAVCSSCARGVMDLLFDGRLDVAERRLGIARRAVRG